MCFTVLTVSWPRHAYSADSNRYYHPDDPYEGYDRDADWAWYDKIKDLPSIAYDMSSWSKFFNAWKYRSKVIRDHAIRTIFETLDDASDLTTRKNIILGLQRIREDLPVEVRWILSAFEVDYRMETPLTAEDAQLAVLSTLLTKPKSVYEMTDTTIYDGALIYFNPGDTADRQGQVPLYVTQMGSLRRMVFLLSRWHASAAKIYRSISENQLRSRRLGWVQTLDAMSTKHLSVAEYEEIFTLMDNPNFWGKGTSYEDRMLLEIWNIVVSLRHQNAHSYEDDQQTVYETYSESARRPMDQILGLFKKWTINNLPFLLFNYQDLREAGVTSLDEIFARSQESISESLQLEDIINQKFMRTLSLDAEMTKKVKVDAATYFITSVLWAFQVSPIPNKGTENAAYGKIMELLQKAKNFMQGVMFSASGLEDNWLNARDFNFLLQRFYDVHKIRALPKEAAENLLRYKSLRTENLTDAQWSDLEWSRLEAVGNSMPVEQFKEALVQQVFGNGGADLYARLLAAKYLRLKMKVPDLDQISTRVKANEEGVKAESYKGVSLKTWKKNDGDFITLMAALNPGDEDLRNYLSEIYVKNQVDGPVGPRDALAKLIQIGFAPEWLKVELIRRVSYISGDTFGNFDALLSLFPQEGEAIARVIASRLRQRDQLTTLLQLLIEHAKNNPSLVDSIREGLKNSSNTDLVKTAYQGLSLDKWVEQRMTMPTIPRAPKALACTPSELATLTKTGGE